MGRIYTLRIATCQVADTYQSIRNLCSNPSNVTLRSVKPGWNAEGLLRPLWHSYEGHPELPRREALAKAVGTSPSVLSQINTGKRPLGHDLGPRLAAELGVSLLELGAPEAVADDPASLKLRDRLEKLGTKVEYLLEREADLSLQLEDAQLRLGRLENAGKPARSGPTRQERRGP